ncbi:hypothetical protein E2C01_050929 [Portunus trituberculatus]|uniref:Uncharacterized protein n=1 Tax=Portunus trituberculatus TaxID=210409 RepID=A0A5B7GA93_PORTR|nr:hypothetical protein [Portunus trituberculatus]
MTIRNKGGVEFAELQTKTTAKRTARHLLVKSRWNERRTVDDQIYMEAECMCKSPSGKVNQTTIVVYFSSSSCYTAKLYFSMETEPLNENNDHGINNKYKS